MTEPKGTTNVAEPAVSRPSTLPSLTGLRFFAALLVFLTHSNLTADPLKPTTPLNFFGNHQLATVLSTIFGNSAYIGVSFFFVLSGFVITWSTREGTKTTAFWRRRLCKIFPNHVVVWVAAMVLFAAATTPRIAWAPSLLLVHSWFPVPTIFTSVNAPSWTLCSELLFYMLFPLLILGIRRIPERRLWPAALLAVGGTVLVCLITVFVLPSTPKPPLLALSFPQQWFSYTFPPARLPEFVLGMVLARIVQAGRWPRVGIVPVLLLSLAGYLATIYLPSPFNFSLCAIIPIAAVICTAATSDLRGARTFLHSRTMQWLGNVSFAFYLCQGVVIFYGRPKLYGDGAFPVPVAIAFEISLFLLTLLVGWLLYTFVESPVMRRWSRSRRQPSTVVAPAAAPAG